MSLPEYDSNRRRPRAIEELYDLVVNRTVLRAFISRNLKVRYKRSVLGVAWTLAQPAMLLIVLTLVFSRVFASYTSFYPAYLGPGILLWFFFSQTTAIIVAEVAGGVDLWRRVRIPRTSLATATVCTGLLNLVFGTVPLILVLAAVGHPLGLALLSLPLVALIAAMFALGLSLALAAVALYFPDVADLYTVVLSAWMFFTPIVYPSSILPPGMQRLVVLNPLTWFTEGFRRPIYENAPASARAFAIMFATAAVMLVAGWYLFTRSADELPYRG